MVTCSQQITGDVSPTNHGHCIKIRARREVPWAFYVRCTELVPCPVCQGSLKVIGSRRRGGKRLDGSGRTIVVRRLKCPSCSKVHHELPDCLVPYKRYERECIEPVLSDNSVDASIVPADDRTMARWRCWAAALVVYWLGCLSSLTLLFGTPVRASSRPEQSVHQRIGQVVGHAVGWLARLARPIANANLWLHTRSA